MHPIHWRKPIALLLEREYSCQMASGLAPVYVSSWLSSASWILADVQTCPLLASCCNPTVLPWLSGWLLIQQQHDLIVMVESVIYLIQTLACNGLGICRLLPGSSQGSLQRLSLILHLWSTLLPDQHVLNTCWYMSHARETYVLLTLSTHMMVTWYNGCIASVDGTSMHGRQHTCMLSLNGAERQHTLPRLQGSYASSYRSISTHGHVPKPL